MTKKWAKNRAWGIYDDLSLSSFPSDEVIDILVGELAKYIEKYEEAPLEDGFYWFTSERSSYSSVCQFLNGHWYAMNESGQLTLEGLNRRGWQLGSRIEESDVE